jgi:protein TonB
VVIPGKVPVSASVINRLLAARTLAGPRHVVPLEDVPETGTPTTAGPIAGPGIALASLPAGIPEPAPQKPAVKPAEPPAPPKQLRVGGDVQAAALIFGPKPAYPALAKAARVQGTVKLQAVIAADGTIRNLQVASGHPLLARAAVDAVSQWRYRPTTLGGAPVEVITEILVNFALN